VTGKRWAFIHGTRIRAMNASSVREIIHRMNDVAAVRLRETRRCIR
jgi:hypothetical protein